MIPPFDRERAERYRERYPDVGRAYPDPEGAYEHFIEYGRREGRAF